jgi:hypothetical protein
MFAGRSLLLHTLAPGAVSSRNHAQDGRATHLLVHHARRAQPVAQRDVGIVLVLGCLVREVLHAQRRAERGHGER